MGTPFLQIIEAKQMGILIVCFNATPSISDFQAKVSDIRSLNHLSISS
jgi:hypothetical protein